MVTHPTENQQDKRTFERISISEPISVFHHQSEEPAKMIDLSLQGTGFVAHDIINEGESLRLKFQLLQSQSPFEIMGKVVHSTKIRSQYLIGLLFTDIDKAHQYAIQEFIKHHRKMAN